MLLQIDVDIENGGMSLNEEFLVDFKDKPDGPVLAHEIRYLCEWKTNIMSLINYTMIYIDEIKFYRLSNPNFLGIPEVIARRIFIWRIWMQKLQNCKRNLIAWMGKALCFYSTHIGTRNKFIICSTYCCTFII